MKDWWIFFQGHEYRNFLFSWPNWKPLIFCVMKNIFMAMKSCHWSRIEINGSLKSVSMAMKFLNKSKLNLMGHKTYSTRFCGPWNCHGSLKLTIPDFNGSWKCVHGHEKSEIWTPIKLMGHKIYSNRFHNTWKVFDQLNQDLKYIA